MLTFKYKTSCSLYRQQGLSCVLKAKLFQFFSNRFTSRIYCSVIGSHRTGLTTSAALTPLLSISGCYFNFSFSVMKMTMQMLICDNVANVAAESIRLQVN